MKESKAYQLAQKAVLTCDCLNDEDILAVLRVLFTREDLALVIEKEKEKENG